MRKKYIIGLVIAVVAYMAGTVENDADSKPKQDRTGTLQGTVELHGGSQVVRRDRGMRYGDPTMDMAAANAHSNENENVVICLEGRGLSVNGEPGKATMNQKNATFIPHVLPVLKGTTVEFVNEDKTYHNVFSLSSIKKFNIGRRPTGEVVPVRFDKTGVAEIFCDIHSYMSAFIVVLDNSYFAKPDARGFFKIENIPPGAYTMKVWHERLHCDDESVTVTAGGTTTVHPVLE